MTLSQKAVEAAARAIIKARQGWSDREGPFGVYYFPYSVASPHAVRDFRPGAEAKIVARFDTHEEAMAECALLTERHFLTAALAVDGLCLVPKEPSDKMIEAGCEHNPTQWNEGTDLGFAADVANDVYRAMLAAASDVEERK